MSFINQDGTLNSSKIVSEIKRLAKTLDDNIYYYFDDLPADKRVIALENQNKLSELARAIELDEDKFFQS